VIIGTATSAHQERPVAFLIFWSLAATTMGWLLATNYRGFLDRFIVDSQASGEAVRRRLRWLYPSLRNERSQARIRVMARIVGGILAIAGPVVLVITVVQTW
jgi:hypothetical protein